MHYGCIRFQGICAGNQLAESLGDGQRGCGAVQPGKLIRGQRRRGEGAGLHGLESRQVCGFRLTEQAVREVFRLDGRLIPFFFGKIGGQLRGGEYPSVPGVQLIPRQTQFLSGQGGELISGVHMGVAVREDPQIPLFSHRPGRLCLFCRRSSRGGLFLGDGCLPGGRIRRAVSLSRGAGG